MPALVGPIKALFSMSLCMLVLVLSWLALRPEAIAGPIPRQHTNISKVHCAAFHKVAAHKDSKRHAAPVKRRTRLHRPQVVKLTVPQLNSLEYAVVKYHEAALLPLTSVYRYVFFREITPPPPKGC